MKTRVKICGLTRREDVDLAVALGASAVGFVLWPGSPRAVAAAAVRDIGAHVPAFVARVGVFVDATADQIERARDEADVDVAQLHGEAAMSGRSRLHLRLVRAVSLGTDADVDRALALPSGVTVLVDAVAGPERGGTGRRADWARAARIARERPVVLAGGLTPETVGEAIATVRPWGVDVASGVESAPGVKDGAMLEAFFRAVERADGR